MVILISKRQCKGLILFLLFFGGMAAVLWEGRRNAVSVSADIGTLSIPTEIVIDPGHGGEDGGAVAGDGTAESAVNLKIAVKLNDLLALCGQQTRMTRTSDRAIYSEGSVTLHEKKVSDLKNRVALVNGTENAWLISIHQNCLPASPRVQGAQVFYNSVSGADRIAQSVQDVLNQDVNADHSKAARQISSTIYLMKHVTAPAILVECGFLSNPSETELLKQPAYQLKLAASIAQGILQSDAAEGNPS